MMPEYIVVNALHHSSQRLDIDEEPHTALMKLWLDGMEFAVLLVMHGLCDLLLIYLNVCWKL